MWTKHAIYRGLTMPSPLPRAPLTDGILNHFLLLGQLITHDSVIVQPTRWPYNYMCPNIRIAPQLHLVSLSSD